jgi:hypothetical protein
MTVVLSTGKYLTVNSHQYPDLFWAMRGGGGGTYGILTSVTYRTYPSLHVAAVFFNATTESANTTQALFTELLRITPQLSDAGWAGYGGVTNNSMYFSYIAPNVTATVANASVQSYFQYAANMTGVVSQQAYVVQYPSWYTWYTQLYTNGTQDGENLLLGSRLLPREVLETKYQELSNSMFPLGTLWKYV